MICGTRGRERENERGGGVQKRRTTPRTLSDSIKIFFLEKPAEEAGERTDENEAVNHGSVRGGSRSKGGRGGGIRKMVEGQRR